jgi:hypothetical protein
MAATTTIPVVISPDAARRVEELGMRRELEEMLDHTRRAVAALRSIEVSLYHDPDEPGQPHVVLTGWRDGPASVDLATWDQWVDWFVRAFPPHVCRWFSFEVRYRGADGR